MNRRRLLIPQIDLSGSQIGDTYPIDRELAHYIERVLRLKHGEEIELCDGRQHRWNATLQLEEDGSLSCSLLESLPPKPLPFPIFLAQSLPKGDKFDLILRQGTEVGISGFFPFFSERSLIKLDAKKISKRLQRWQKILREASRQSERDQIPFIQEPLPFEQMLAQLPQPFPKLLCWEEMQRYSLKQWLHELHDSPQGIVIIIGPEGGFSQKEVALAQKNDAIPVGLGPLILRTETAGVSVASILQFSFGLLGGKPLSL